MTTERDVLRELEAALDVSPSPQFEARVRERVRATSRGVPPWTWPAAVAVAATVVLAVMLVPSRPMSPSRVVVRPETTTATTVVRQAGPVSKSTPRVEKTERTMVARRARPATTVNRDVALHVVVPQGQMTAIQRLVAEVAAGRVVVGPERPPLPSVLEISALDIAPPIEFDVIRFRPLSPDASPDLWR